MDSEGIFRTITNNPLHIKSEQTILGRTTRVDSTAGVTRQGSGYSGTIREHFITVTIVNT